MPPETKPPKPDPTSDETLAEAIKKIAASVDRLKRSGLNHDAVIVLLHHETKVSQKTLRIILGELGSLARRYTLGT